MDEKCRSLYFGEFNEGDKFFTQKRLITGHDIDDFAEVSGDSNPIHVDPEFANDSIYGERIAHGLLGLSVVSGLAAELGFAEKTTVAFRELRWKFKKPILVGDTISAVFEVIEKKDIPIKDAGLIVFRVLVSNQNDQQVQNGKWSLIIMKKQ